MPNINPLSVIAIAAPLFDSCAKSAVSGIMICGVTVRAAMIKLRPSKTAKLLVTANPIERVAVIEMSNKTRDLRRTRSPRGEMSRIPIA